MQTPRDLAAAIDRLLPLCDAVAKAPRDLAARAALGAALAPLADRTFPYDHRDAVPQLQGLRNMVHVQAAILCERLSARADEPPEFAAFLVNKAGELITTLAELRKGFDGLPTNGGS